MTERSALSFLRARRWWVGGAAAIVLLAAFVFTRGDSSEPPITTADVQRVVDGSVGKAVKDLQAAPAHSAAVYNAIRASLVLIESGQDAPDADADPDADPDAGDDVGFGSGVIVNDQGSILTALHVVDDATTLRITFADGTEASGFLQSSDPEHDIAVIGTDRLPEVLVPAVLGGGARVGDEAVVVGHPLGYVGSLTAGVISGLDRSIPRPGGSRLEGLIQFDAAVNPGSSGGPLLDRAGRVVGIVTALANGNDRNEFIGIGFAVPIGTAGGAAGAPPR